MVSGSRSSHSPAQASNIWKKKGLLHFLQKDFLHFCQKDFLHFFQKDFLHFSNIFTTFSFSFGRGSILQIDFRFKGNLPKLGIKLLMEKKWKWKLQKTWLWHFNLNQGMVLMDVTSIWNFEILKQARDEISEANKMLSNFDLPKLSFQ